MASDHACAISSDDSLYCWGDADPNGFTEDVATPTKIGSDKWLSVATAYNDSCAVRADGTLWCWGDSRPIPASRSGATAPGLESRKRPATSHFSVCARAP